MIENRVPATKQQARLSIGLFLIDIANMANIS